MVGTLSVLMDAEHSSTVTLSGEPQAVGKCLLVMVVLITATGGERTNGEGRAEWYGRLRDGDGDPILLSLLLLLSSGGVSSLLLSSLLLLSLLILSRFLIILFPRFLLS